ncbi:MAG: hypothetical protein L6R42_000036 [Xanthoria sp. 1 TBL-2021]|nr:MAG: hypothetical protein L6R42_000036 [Xanthoria sp. 1 TBL-2021]
MSDYSPTPRESLKTERSPSVEIPWSTCKPPLSPKPSASREDSSDSEEAGIPLDPRQSSSSMDPFWKSIMRNLGARFSISTMEDSEDGRHASNSKASGEDTSSTTAEGVEDSAPVDFRTDTMTTSRTRDQHESPPCSPLTTLVVRHPEAAGSWIADRVTKEISDFASVRQRYEKQIESLKVERFKLQRVYMRVSRELAETGDKIEGLNKQLLEEEGHVKEARSQEIHVIRSMKRKFQQASNMLEDEERKRIKFTY